MKKGNIKPVYTEMQEKLMSSIRNTFKYKSFAPENLKTARSLEKRGLITVFVTKKKGNWFLVKWIKG